MDFLRYGLATGVAKVLGATDYRVEEVYIFSFTPDEAPMNATVHLLVKVNTPSAALDTLVASLDRALVASLKELPSLVFAHRSFILDVRLVGEEVWPPDSAPDRI